MDYTNRMYMYYTAITNTGRRIQYMKQRQKGTSVRIWSNELAFTPCTQPPPPNTSTKSYRAYFQWLRTLRFFRPPPSPHTWQYIFSCHCAYYLWLGIPRLFLESVLFLQHQQMQCPQHRRCFWYQHFPPGCKRSSWWLALPDRVGSHEVLCVCAKWERERDRQTERERERARERERQRDRDRQGEGGVWKMNQHIINIPEREYWHVMSLSKQTYLQMNFDPLKVLWMSLSHHSFLTRGASLTRGHCSLIYYWWLCWHWVMGVGKMHNTTIILYSQGKILAGIKFVPKPSLQQYLMS